MCGRYTLRKTTDQIALRFDVTTVLAESSVRYNAAPSQNVAVVIASPEGRILDTYRWGLIPSWAKDMSIGSKLINARAETVAEKPSFRTSFSRRRCLVPADGYYEWRQDGKLKQPVFYSLMDDQLFAFAGLHDEWRTPDGEKIRTVTILTTIPNELASIAHDRMPVILDRHNEAIWLDTSSSQEHLASVLVPYDAHAMQAWPVSRRVNSAGPDDPSLVSPELNYPQDPGSAQTSLF